MRVAPGLSFVANAQAATAHATGTATARETDAATATKAATATEASTATTGAHKSDAVATTMALLRTLAAPDRGPATGRTPTRTAAPRIPHNAAQFAHATSRSLRALAVLADPRVDSATLELGVRIFNGEKPPTLAYVRDNGVDVVSALFDLLRDKGAVTGHSPNRVEATMLRSPNPRDPAMLVDSAFAGAARSGFIAIEHAGPLDTDFYADVRANIERHLESLNGPIVLVTGYTKSS